MRSFEVLVDNQFRHDLNKHGIKFFEKNYLRADFKEALSNASKSGDGQGFPDFMLDVNVDDIAVVIENKYGSNISTKDNEDQLIMTPEAIQGYALNGAVHYGQKILENLEKINYVYAIGYVGREKIQDPEELLTEMECVLLTRDSSKPINISSVISFSPEVFKDFHKENLLGEKERQERLEKARKDLEKKAKELNQLMNDNAVTVEYRVIYTSGCLIAMEAGLVPEDLKDGQFDTGHGDQIVNRIESFLRQKDVKEEKREMMMGQFRQISLDKDRDAFRPNHKVVRGKYKGHISEGYSVNKEIFTYIYDNIYTEITSKSHIDVLGGLYSEFLRYSLGDGKDNGIVLTPSYVTEMMCRLIDVNRHDRVLDLCMGSGGFLVEAMNEMIMDAEDHHVTYDTSEIDYQTSISNIKQNQLLGVELDAKMFTLAATNMILRGDGSSQLIKGDAFNVVKSNVVKDFKATKALLNPPFSYDYNGQPFVQAALNVMAPGGLCAVIIQDSVGSGTANKINKDILEEHTLLLSVKMPKDLFLPNAGVQTSIYVLQAHQPHDFRKKVLFIDFSEDGYKRTKRGTQKIGDPDRLYEEVVDVWHLDIEDHSEISLIKDQITDSGDDWNYHAHVVYDTTPTEEDFLETVGEYLEYRLSEFLAGRD